MFLKASPNSTSKAVAVTLAWAESVISQLSPLLYSDGWFGLVTHRPPWDVAHEPDTTLKMAVPGGCHGGGGAIGGEGGGGGGLGDCSGVQ